MDSYKNFLTFKTDHTILKLHKKEAELLRPYFESEIERSIATYEKKYKLKLEARCRSRSIPTTRISRCARSGMPGLGALGVTFGYVDRDGQPVGPQARAASTGPPRCGTR